jgi:tetratricopeptide (TPR) repeat protein
MRLMSRKKTLALLALCFAAAAAGMTVALWLLLAPAASSSLQERLAQTDDFIARSYLGEADASLAGAYRAAGSPDDVLRVLKRGYALALLKKDYRSLKERAVESFERFPFRPELCRIALYACLRDGDVVRALSLKHQFQSLPEVQALQAEVLLKNETPETDPALAALPALARYATLEAGRDPERFMTAGRELGDDRFFLDAALLFLAAGKTSEAETTARAHLLDPQFDEVSGLIAYDAGDTEEAVNRLQGAAGVAKRPDLYVILGDSLLERAQFERAAGFYEQALQADRFFSFVPYLNLAWVSQRQGFDEKALALLREADARFPDSAAAVFEYVKLLFRRGEKAEARRVLDEYLKRNPDDFEARFLKLHLEEDEYSAEHYLLRLKDMYFEHPKNERIAAELVATLFVDEDLSGARAILTHYAEVTGSGRTGWAEDARGLLEAVEGNLNQATARLGEAIALQDRWEYRYNRASVFLEMGKLEAARTDLSLALSQLETPSSRLPEERRSLVHARLAAVSLAMGNSDEAERELNLALSLDPKNGEARRVRRKLDDARHER